MSALTSSLTSISGFHTSYKTHINLSHSFTGGCSLHLVHSLPPHIFVDLYELVHHQHSYAFSHWGTSNLELPVAAVDAGGSVLLLNVTLPAVLGEALHIDVEVPLHARYGEPTSLGYYTAEIPRPVSFLACPASYSGHTGPLPSMPTPLSSLFNSSSHVFITLPMTDNPFPESFRVPVGNHNDLLTVEIGTSLTIILLFFALSHALCRTAGRLCSNQIHMKTR